MTDQPAPQPPAIVYESEHDIADALMDRAGMSPARAYEVASGLAGGLIEAAEESERLERDLGHDNCVPAQHCERCGIRMVATPDKDVDNALIRAERAEAERDRLRACLSVLLRDIDEGEVTGGDPMCVDLWVTVNHADLDEARAALDGEDTA